MYKKNSKGDLDLHPTPNPSLNPAHDNVDTQKQSSAGYRQGGGGGGGIHMQWFNPNLYIKGHL